jgi:tetratricopeptide (TPR) repeat protein
MRTTVKIAKSLSLVAFLVPIMLASSSCGKEAPAPEKTAPQQQATNPYSSESVFTEVKKKLQENPNDVDALYHLADLYDRSALYQKAIDTYKKVVQLKPAMGYAYFKMGTAYDRLNQPSEAINAFKKAIKHMPDYAVAHNNMGVAYGRLEKYGEEIKALQKAIRLRPAYSSARFNLGVTYLKTGNRKAAMQEYESLKKFDEGTAEALMREIKKAS